MVHLDLKIQSCPDFPAETRQEMLSCPVLSRGFQKFECLDLSWNQISEYLKVLTCLDMHLCCLALSWIHIFVSVSCLVSKSFQEILSVSSCLVSRISCPDPSLFKTWSNHQIGVVLYFIFLQKSFKFMMLCSQGL